MPFPADEGLEWLEADGLGGFASGTVAGTRTRRYHALLLAAATPPTGRMVLVNGFDAWVQTPSGQYAVSSQRYAPQTTYPDGAWKITAFGAEPWPRWRLRLDDGSEIEQEIFVPHGSAAVAVTWRLVAPRPGAVLRLRPFLSGRDYHALHRENADFQFAAEGGDGRLVWRPYPGVPAVLSLANAHYAPDPTWYRNFLYKEELARGLDATEDLASPGTLTWDLSAAEAVWILAAERDGAFPIAAQAAAPDVVATWRDRERQRRTAASRLARAADAYLVARQGGRTIIAGYPWFTDWGRDTFIALRGLCLAGGRLHDARDILVAWAATVSQGMLPNRFPDHGAAPEFNSVDASLWYIVAVHDFLTAAAAQALAVTPADTAALHAAVDAILAGYSAGTRFGIRCDADGLLAAGEPGVQLTWMDAKVGDWVVTPRIGKPVEIQALWLNALAIGGQRSTTWAEGLARGRTAFAARFWNAARGCLFDVVDCDHAAGTADAALRPNQILAVGGLPLALLDGERARRVVDLVEQQLWTPLGLRTLAPGEPGYVGRYQGDARSRDGCYHQGTAWPWLLGPFVDAWLRVRDNTPDVRAEARRRFLAPLRDHLDRAGLGHVSEIADGDAPHTPRGCPFQAWSVGAALRLERLLDEPG
ncbi:MAG: amylo-alpha-1,6-glucosidase [Candidatus Binatia bacterium]